MWWRSKVKVTAGLCMWWRGHPLVLHYVILALKGCMPLCRSQLIDHRYSADYSLLTHTGSIATGVGMAFIRVCLSVCLHSNKKTAWAINTKLGTRILYSSRSACIDPEVKRSVSKNVGQGHTVTKNVTIARLLVKRAATAIAVMGLRVHTTAYVKPDSDHAKFFPVGTSTLNFPQCGGHLTCRNPLPLLSVVLCHVIWLNPDVIQTRKPVAWLSGWLHSTAVERRSSAGVLSLYCARPVADAWPLMWVNRPL